MFEEQDTTYKVPGGHFLQKELPIPLKYPTPHGTALEAEGHACPAGHKLHEVCKT